MKFLKSRKAFFLYNPDTLNFERVYPSAKKRFFGLLRYLSVGVAIGVVTFFLFMYFFDSPMEALLRKENKLLKTQYEILSLQVEGVQEVLEDIQQRDEGLYRAILQTESIPESVRKSGFGGSNRYEHLLTLPYAELVASTTKQIDVIRKQLYVQSKSFDELIKIGETWEDRAKHIPAIQPVSNKDLRMTASGYGLRIDPIYRTPRFHSGMDFSAPKGTDVYATGDGKVTYASWKQEYGKCIMIDHGYGYQTLYAHLDSYKVRVGQQVVRGEVIGKVGNTGKSTGNHLHYEVLVKGRHDNPAKYYFMDLSPEEYDMMIRIAENHGQVMD